MTVNFDASREEYTALGSSTAASSTTVPSGVIEDNEL